MAARIVKSVPDVFNRILAIFPSKIQFAFAYGSGVFEQVGTNTKENMIDIVLAVDDTSAFHAENLKKNKSHYSFLRYGGSKLITRVQQEFGAGVYYNTLIPFEKRLLKYGIVSRTSLIADLLDWETLYLSGRLHKPVLVLKHASDSAINSALQMNLNNAVHTSLLLLPETFSEEEFYLKITGLSYTGDFRMWAGEDRNKVVNIVKANFEHFRQLYAQTFNSIQHVHWQENNGIIEQDWSPTSRLHHLNLLPKQLQINIYKLWNKDGRQRDLEDVLKVIAYDVDCEEVIQEGVENIVWKSSWNQSLKGILTAGVSKSIRYSASKLKKMVNSWGRSTVIKSLGEKRP